ncbi:mechanosensitive ion channel family protein [Symbiobacterium terraclitae]|uniref:mechanosensitive ion channel family protein n=1 Tax=Symbiobacterium terraclitae TaxID=557451 RepID=UPI0035B56DED
MLSWNFYGNPLQDWLIALAVAAGTYLVLAFIIRVVVGRLHRLAAQTSTQVDDAITDVLGRTAVWFKLYVGVYAGAQALVLPPATQGVLRNLLVIVLALQIGIWGNRMISHWAVHFIRTRNGSDQTRKTMAGAVGFLGRLILISCLLLLTLQNMGVEIDALLAGLGIGGVAVALSVQNVLGDLFASLSIMFDQPFLVGDFIILDNGMMGTVEHVGLKTTRLRALTGEELIIANTDVVGTRIQNLRQMQKRMVRFTIRVVYQTPREKLERIPAIIKEVVDQHPRTRFDWAAMIGFGTYAYEFDVAYWVEPYGWYPFMEARQEIYLEILRRFEEEDIQLAYPTQTLVGQLPQTGA